MKSKKGVLIWWSRAKHCGVIIADSGERYFVHLSRIVRGPIIPPVDSTVTFEVADKPPLPGRLQSAVNVVILGAGDCNKPASEEPVNAGIAALQTEVKS